MAVHAIAAGPVIAVRICSARVLAILTVHVSLNPWALLALHPCALLAQSLLTIGTLERAFGARDLNVVGPMAAVVLADGVAADTGENDKTRCCNATDGDKCLTRVAGGWR